jgi:hypothetical protein
MGHTVQITTTTATILRHAVELAGDRQPGEDRWEHQARTLGELGYAIVTAHDAVELERLRKQLADARAKAGEVAQDGFDSLGLRDVEAVLNR